MDGFNYIYDNYRHNTGDKLLVCSQYMRDALRECDTLEFIGGDEFMVELDDLEMPNDCKPTLERLQKVASQTICLSDVLLNFSAGMDVAIYPQSGGGGGNSDLLICQANQIMRIAKESSKNRYHF
jgi:diguanylate cyclase (GGDEF)-like protein